ncbi:tetratricopeptide repeat protein [Pontiella sp.]|uniref:tetratricopeptide repeat protein n=1 Tax=Pontiella sp. TaxID=2837462 RepID=UPI00356216B4
MKPKPTTQYIHLTLLFLAASVCLAAAAPKNQESAEEIYERAMTVFKIDPEAAMSLFQKSAKLGHTESMLRIGHCFETGTGTASNPKTAVQWYKKSVEAGNPAALVQIGSLYESDNKKFPPDYAEAIDWYEQAVTNTASLKACAGLARIYAACPDPTFHNGPKALLYATVLAKKEPDNPESFDLLAAAYMRNLEFANALKAASKAILLSPLDEAADRRARRETYENGVPFPAVATDEWIQEAAELQSMWAMLKLADAYNDLLAEGHNPELARLWYEKAAENGDLQAQVQLGTMCYHGIGGDVNFEKAFWCFGEAAQADVAEAYAPLARMYVGGKGVRSDFKLAKEWYQRAVDAGEKNGIQNEFSAIRQLDKLQDAPTADALYEAGRLLERNGDAKPDGTKMTYSMLTSRIYSYYWVAAELGSTDAMRAVAEMHFYGPRYFVREGLLDKKNGGLAVNFAKALEWYEELARKGILLPEYARAKEGHLQELAARRAKYQKTGRK